MACNRSLQWNSRLQLKTVSRIDNIQSNDAYGPKESILVIGLGEVGKPLLDVLSDQYNALGIDVAPIEMDGECDVMQGSLARVIAISNCRTG